MCGLDEMIDVPPEQLAEIRRILVGFRKLSRLIEAFQESTLPFRVDVLDWHEASPAFQAIITREYEIVQTSQPAGVI